jgi:hypothetical protein
MQALLNYKKKVAEKAIAKEANALKPNEVEAGEIDDTSMEKERAIAEAQALASAETKLNSVDSTKAFEEMVTFYLASNPFSSVGGKINELEIAFGTNPRKGRPITKIDYDNIVRQFKAAGFVTKDPEGLYMLRMNNEYYDVRTKKTKTSNIRAELIGIDLIQEYCKTNNLQKILDNPNMIFSADSKIKFTQKTLAQKKENETLFPVDFEDFNFRCSYKKEQDYSKDSNIGKSILREWTNQKKTFRYMNRVRFEHPELPFFLDISILKSSKKTGKVPIPQYTIQDAGVFENPETYEVELELDNSKVGTGTRYDTAPKLLDALRKGIRIVLSGIQGTNYPIAYSEKDKVLLEYMKLLYGPDFEMRRIKSNDFCGPSSVTLQVKNLMDNGDRSIPNILQNYCVTDKADGIRTLLYVADNGRIYLIDGNMNVMFTGAYTDEKTVLNTLLDGELIKYNKKGDYINLFAAFDIYYLQGKSVREYAFEETDDGDGDQEHYRRILLINATAFMKPKSIVKSAKDSGKPTDNCNFRIKCKQFQVANINNSIFRACATILSDIDQGIYEYNTDGLIFTPINTGVASQAVGIAGSLNKPLWEQSFKWKPAEFNTIDFLVRVKKDKNGQDEVHNVFQQGKNLVTINNIKQYKTLILCCGFDKEKHRFINPFESMISDNLPNVKYDNEEKYSPVPFRPTNPFDENACYCNVELKSGEMRTEENEVFGEHMIIEFRYDINLTGSWKWVPLRVRYDKTAELHNGAPNYGNAYHVANSNWHSIHDPITKEMIMTGEGIPEIDEDSDVYYNRDSREINTDGLRDFHNLYVKKKIILGVSQRKQSLIDYAVGKAGDLPKWIRAHLGFVFGIDKSNSNIFDPLDGACARYIKSAKEYTKDFPKALFLEGNSGNNIRSGKAFKTEKEKQIARAIFGNGPKDRQVLKEAVYKQYGVAQEGFNISSCQFALHYFFENNVVFHEFLRNLAECTALGGYFIGTCYDGKTVFKRLQQKIKGEGIAIMKRDRKVYEINKMYDETGFPDDETSVGYMIHVYQDSINKTFPEYLVNFNYLVQMLSNYGFALIKKEEAGPIGLPNGTGLFSELFTEMELEIAQNPQRANDYKKAISMTEDEKWISFMNRYFVFKKTHNVDAERIYKQFVSKKMLGDLAKQADELEDALELANEKAKEAKKSKIRKLSSKEKVVIDTYSPVLDSAEDIMHPQEIERIASSVAAIASEEEEPRVLAEDLAPIPSSVSVSDTKPKLVLGSPISIKVTKPKIVIGEPVKVIKKIKKADK